ncbi:MAG: radical SAM protein [Deltaproteobacteria bacterium]|nr:radical SAM protein [Deltaproteobacteria bacterium]
MHVCFIGADFEENLGVAILAAIVEKLGHRWSILAFNTPADADACVRRVMAERPEVVGMSMQFQHRAHEFLALGRKLRDAGYRGHMTAGAQFPTLAFKEVLEHGHGFDSVVLHDGEETLPELLAALDAGRPLHEVPGLALPGADGAAFRTASRRLPDDLDSVPFAKRYRQHTRHVGVPFVPIVASRGCWGRCNYCSIVAFYKDAHDTGGGSKLMRMRSPENVAAEIALLWHTSGPSIFCFHDDNFTLPDPRQTLARVRAIRSALDEYGVGLIGIVGKARPDTVTRELALELAELGVIRLYVGVENGSETGGEHLRRGTQQRHIREALSACREAGIFNCYNLLMFEPDATMEHVRENIQFIRTNCDRPVNFCRAEPYHGTPLHVELSAIQDLGGSYMGWNYRIADDRTEMMFRVCSAAFRERNFATQGVANRYMGIGYAANVVKRFYPAVGAQTLWERARDLTTAISLDTAEHLERAADLVESTALGDHDALARQTALLGLAIAEADRRFHHELDGLYADFNHHAARVREQRGTHKRSQIPRKLLGIARSVMVGASLATLGSACGDDDTVARDVGIRDAGPDVPMVVDPAPRDLGIADAGPEPMDAEPDVPMVVDPAPPDLGPDDAGEPDVPMVVDPAPPDLGPEDSGPMVVDPPPPDMGMSAIPAERDPMASAPVLEGATPRRRLRLIDQWVDSSPRESVRTDDLALSDPPSPRLRARREGDVVHVAVEGVRAPVTTRWESEGAVEGEGLDVRWSPVDSTDQIRVAVRSRNGVAVVTLRASAVPAA